MSKFKPILAAIFDNIHAIGFVYFSGSLLTKKSLEQEKGRLKIQYFRRPFFRYHNARHKHGQTP